MLPGLPDILTLLATQAAHPPVPDAGVAARFGIFEGYINILIAAFIVTVATTPIVRWLAISNGVVDHPSDPRKIHKMPIAYLGGVAVYLGIMAGIFISYLAVMRDGIVDYHTITKAENFVNEQTQDPLLVPWSILLGLTIITIVGLWDDVASISPTYKIAGQLFAAAALAYQDVGVNVAADIIHPLIETLNLPVFGVVDELGTSRTAVGFQIDLPGSIPVLGWDQLQIDFVYWIGTALIALFVLGGCNASNLIDGLDGLLSGTTAICTAGLLVIALGLAAVDSGPRDAQRIVLCMAVLGACLGFLPHNFNPANIFLGDCGSMLLGYATIVIILTLGNEGQTYLVLSGLIIYGIPITDTALAIVRRKMAGKRMSDPDSDHLHHMLKRAFGVKGAVFTLYGIGIGFAALGVAISEFKAGVAYAAALIFASYIGVYSTKIARRAQLEKQAMDWEARRAAEAFAGAAAASSTPAPDALTSPESASSRPGVAAAGDTRAPF